ncbi:MAG: hypothetical protein AAF664_23585, partial [Planctomycetota bacterium]
EGGIRVPTFISGPGIVADSQCDQPVMGIDLLPTIWDWAGGDADQLPGDIDGGSLVPAIEAAGSKSTDLTSVRRPGELVVHSPHYVLTKDGAKNQRPSSAIFDGKWKLVAWYETGDIHLFDLESDISESTDASGSNSEVKEGLHVRLRDYLANVEARMPSLDPRHPSNAGGKEGDADNDGLPDYWEFKELLTHSFGPQDDPDGDGKTNQEEYNMKTDPLTAQSNQDAVSSVNQ